MRAHDRSFKMRRMNLPLSILFMLLVVFTLAAPVAAQSDEPTDDEVNAIAKRLYCPVCENIPLDVCAEQACKDWREDIRIKLAAGWTDDQIIQYFLEQHGAKVLSAPPPEGLNLMVYILPPVVLIAGAIVLVRVIRSWQKMATPVETSPTMLEDDDPYAARLEEELRRRK
jgi:cytochrome c-type biogenesis protein CcmH